MNRAGRVALTAAVSAVIAVGGVLVTAGAAPHGSLAGVGQAAPAMRGPALVGRERDLVALRGQVVLVTVWASWCAPCRAELTTLAQETTRRPGLALLGVDFRDSASAARDLLRSTGAGLPTVSDPDGRLSVAWGVSGVPESFLIDAAGVVRARLSGPVDEDWLSRVVDPVLTSVRTAGSR